MNSEQLDWVLEADTTDQRALKTIGLKAIAASWVLFPEKFDNVSGNTVAGMHGVNRKTFASRAAEFSRKFNVQNVFQKKHDWQNGSRFEAESIDQKVSELVNIPEAARRLGVCDATLKRHVRNSGTIPDAVLPVGARGRESFLFSVNRLQELGELIPKNPKSADETATDFVGGQLVDGVVLLEILFPKKCRPTLRWLRDQRIAKRVPFRKIGRLVFFDPDEVREALKLNHKK